MYNPLVTVFTPLFNNGRYVIQGLDCVKNQTYKNIEHIIIDDCSSDNSVELVEDWIRLNNYPALFIKEPVNKGLVHRLNQMIGIARGEFLSFIGDDMWAPEKTERQVNCFSTLGNEYAAVWGNCNVNNEINKQSSLYVDNFAFLTGLSRAEMLSLNGYDLYYNLLKCNFIHPLGCLYRMSLVKAVGGYHSGYMAEDWYLHLKLAKLFKFKSLDEIFCTYRKHEGAFTIKNRAKMSLNIVMMFHEFCYNNASEKDIINKTIKFWIEEAFKNDNEVLNKYLEKHSINKSQFETIKKYYPSANITNEIKLEINMAPNYDDFLAPKLAVEFMDKYFIRKAILTSIDEACSKFSGILLDIGCGEMPYRELIIEKSKLTQYIGLDIENPLYQSIIKPNLYWDGKHIPLGDNSVDCIMATEVFEHLPNLDNVLLELSRVLKPGGFVFFTVPFIWSLHTVPNDEYRYTPFSLERHLKAAGLDNIKIHAQGGWNAALAQVIGLWSRRKPMSDAERRDFSDKFFPLYKFLLENDEVPNEFSEGLLVPGFYGYAYKSSEVQKQKVEADPNINNFQSAKVHNPDLPVLAIFTPNIGTLTETFIQRQIDHLLPGNTVVVAGNVLDQSQINFPFLQIPFGEGKEIYNANIEKKVIEFLEENHVTHILCEYGMYGTGIVELNARKLKKPIFVHFHGGDASSALKSPSIVDYYKWMGQNVTGVIAVSQKMKERLINIGIPAEKIYLNHYGIEPLSPSLAYPEMEPCNFLFVGRFVAKKAPMLLVKAFSKALKLNPNIFLHIIGGNYHGNDKLPLQLEVENYIQSEKLGRNIILYGQQKHDFVIKSFLSSSCYIQHSITDPITGDKEGLPNTILEAMSFGLPVISTNHEGIPEAVEHSVTGYIVEEGDIDQMADYILDLAANPRKRKEMGIAGRRRYLDHFTIERYIGGLRKIIGIAENQDNSNEQDIIAIINSGDYSGAELMIYDEINNNYNNDLLILLSFIKLKSGENERAKSLFETAVKSLTSELESEYLEFFKSCLVQLYCIFPQDTFIKGLASTINYELKWEDLILFKSIRLYAGDIPENEHYSGVIGLSIEKSNTRHILWDITKRFPINDSSIDYFQSEDVFEHIPLNQLQSVINEIHRVLKPGCRFRLSIPDYRCDVLINRSIKDANGKITFDPGGGGTPENPGHLWFPRYEIVKDLIKSTEFGKSGAVIFYHYYDEQGNPITNTIDYSQGYVMRTPDNDGRVRSPFRPMSIVVDMIKR